MARLLRDLDYLRVIQSDNLAQIIESNQQTKLDVEQSAQSEMIGYLTQRYITNQIFTDTKLFDIAATYNGKQLVEWTAPAFSATTVYTTGQYVLQAGYIYKSIAGSTAHAFLPTEWTQICLDKTLFYTIYPNAEYSNVTTYSVGNIVYYNNIQYTCTVSCVGILPTNNQFWASGAAYTVTAIYPDNTTKWQQGDNRNQQIVAAKPPNLEVKEFILESMLAVDCSASFMVLLKLFFRFNMYSKFFAIYSFDTNVPLNFNTQCNSDTFLAH